MRLRSRWSDAGATFLPLSISFVHALALAQPAVPSRSKSGGALDPAELYRRLAPSVVMVEARVSAGVSQGSGVVVDDGEIVTNFHVVDGASGFILVRQGDRVWRSELWMANKERDLALLRVVLMKKERFELSAVRKRKTNTLRIGERAFAIGAPRGLDRTLSDGLVSGLPSSDEVTLVQTTASISQGSSGGGLFDSQGRLVGITTVYLKGSQNLNFAVSADDVATLQAKAAEWEPVHELEKPAEPVPAFSPSARPTDLPTPLSATQAVLVVAVVDGPVANEGGLSSSWTVSHVADRLRKAGVSAYLSREDALRDGVYAVPLFVEVSSLHIEDSVFYVWRMELKLADSVDFSDGSNRLVDVWTTATHGYGGSKVVVRQVSDALDEKTDQFAIELLKARLK